MRDTIALVTGANRGLGLEIARGLGRAGMTVLVAGRRPASVQSAADDLRAEGLDARPLVLDVTDPRSVRAAAEQVERDHGALDVLVNNAGVLPEATAPDGGEAPVDLDLFLRTFETNLFGVVSVVGAFAPLLRRSADGRIVNVSTTMGSLREQLNPESPYYDLVVPAYQGSKAALNALTIALSKRLEGAVRVDAICPGWLQTDLGGPANRQAAPMTAAEGAEIVVEVATAPAASPTGTFRDRAGAVAW